MIINELKRNEEGKNKYIQATEHILLIRRFRNDYPFTIFSFNSSVRVFHSSIWVATCKILRKWFAHLFASWWALAELEIRKRSITFWIVRTTGWSKYFSHHSFGWDKKQINNSIIQLDDLPSGKGKSIGLPTASARGRRSQNQSKAETDCSKAACLHSRRLAQPLASTEQNWIPQETFQCKSNAADRAKPQQGYRALRCELSKMIAWNWGKTSHGKLRWCVRKQFEQE